VSACTGWAGPGPGTQLPRSPPAVPWDGQTAPVGSPACPVQTQETHAGALATLPGGSQDKSPSIEACLADIVLYSNHLARFAHDFLEG